MFEKTWKIGDPEGERVADHNVQQIQQIFQGLWKKCANPYCRYPISSMKSYGAPGYGDVCATCHDLWSALSFANTQLRNSQYFMAAHEEWKKGGDGGSDWRNKRDKLGL